MLCRGEITLPVEMTVRLKCRYINNNNPFLLIAPFKLEEAHLDPDLYIFHDVMADAEIETIKKLSIPRVRTMVVNSVVFLLFFLCECIFEELRRKRELVLVSLEI